MENIDIIGEDRDKTIITYDDHANINKWVLPHLYGEGRGQ